ncbi:MAG: SusC/RagA family TonB-linked outer membrane protein, partial [Cyclobacteriaceae bacterium]|nr:SusC/RagA family TonB-linked outer membrane protein [Cyclobacteriaceae bacterium HetDA_MAG_MS6]
MKKYLLLSFLSFAVALAMAQDRTVTGKVTDSESGEPVPGANVVVKGSSKGTITDFDGNFEISVSDGTTLVFSFIGFKSQEVPVGALGVVNVSLELDVAQLNEVVVIGYGQIEKKDATGSVASVKSDDFNGGVIASPEQLFQGKVAGVQITGSSGEPGAGVSIRIRGSSSVRNGNGPLFVVDGIPLSGESTSAGGVDLGRGSQAASNPLNFLNPNDIESIDILKDASATAIYGSRGANGVVIITTKSGKGAKSQLSYSSSVSVATVANTLDLLNRDQFLDGAEARGAIRSEIDFDGNTDWQDEIFQAGISHQHDLSYGNSYKNGDYRVSVGYGNQQGIMEKSELERIAGRINLNHRLFNEKLKLGFQGTFSSV